jgi:Na+ dependent nucleoside transporter
MGMQVLWGIGGMVVLLAVAFVFSTDRRAINPRTVVGALVIQIAFAFVVLYWDFGRRGLQVLTNGVQAVIDSSNSGIQFLSTFPCLRLYQCICLLLCSAKPAAAGHGFVRALDTSTTLAASP